MMGRIATLLMAVQGVVGAAPVYVTTRPIAEVQACLAARLAPAGRLVTINTADGVLLALAFESVGEDGRVQVSHIRVDIADRGTQRQVSAAATLDADAPLAQAMLANAAKSCLPDGSTKG